MVKNLVPSLVVISLLEIEKLGSKNIQSSFSIK